MNLGSDTRVGNGRRNIKHVQTASLLVHQCSNNSVGSAVPEDGDKEVLVGLVYSRKSTKYIRNTEDILNLLKTGHQWMKKP